MTIRLLKLFLKAARIVTIGAGLIGVIAVIGNAAGGRAAATTLPLRIDPAASTVIKDASGAAVGTLLLDRGTLSVRGGSLGYSALQFLDIVLTCGFWISLFMLTLRLVDQIGSGQPFSAIAIRRLRVIGWMLIALNLWYWLRAIALPPVLLSAIDPTAGDYRILPAISESVRGFRNARVDVQFGFGLFVGGALVLLLSEAFRLGAMLREENESIL